MDEADVTLQAYDKLSSNIPSIGILSRKKRVIAYLKVTKMAQQMMDDGLISEENAMYLLSTLVRKRPDFQKAAVMAALNLSDIDRKLIKPLGFRYANDMRCSMKMLPVDDTTIYP